MHFLRKQFWSTPMFWNAFFKRTILKCTFVLKCIFKGAILKYNYVLKCIFQGSNFEVHPCSETHFSSEQLFLVSWLLISVASALCFFIKASTTSKTFSVLTCINTNQGLWQTGCNQSCYVSKGICIESLPPLEKSSTSLNKGSVGSTVNGR